MKKIIFSIIILGSIFTLNGNVFGQSTGNMQNTTISGFNIGLDAGGVPNDPTLQASKINYIDTRFCNNGLEENKLTENLSMVIKPGEEKEICIVHFNRDTQDIYLWGGFPDNAIEPNGNTNCSTNYGWDNPFSKFMKPIDEKMVKVPANGYVIRKTTIKFPVGINGTQKGCYAYGTSPGDLQEGQNFLFVIRRIAYIDVLVQGDAKVDSKIKIDKVTSNVDENNKLGIEFNIENNGSVDEAIEINGEFSSIFGFKKDFSITGIVVGVNNKKTLNIKDFGVDIELPRYKGLFNLNLQINHKPYFSFDVSNSGIDPKILEGSVSTQTESVFIFPTLPIVGLLVFLVLVYFAFFRKPKVIIQQVQVPTPTPTVQ